ncbi:hypothetical protein [Polaribacter aquimarinus]|uniref:MetA-pathway of phenol degradation n=1 Tax=Polaribacter aquimarinus TaxID=2100726 RepID=A0A2U2JEX0_9FLAO|nr:hypothetical protein [Polaribacter aquimarinus]PWG06852.1 hypothetical protein DIS07_03160 [Polaribacter aquimarinus]
MKHNFFKIAFTLFLIVSLQSYGQDDTTNKDKSNIQTYTPSKLLDKGQWDIKFFNNLYTETKDLFGPNGTKRTKPRESFLTSTIDVFTGVSENSSFNIGLLLEFRSNVIAGRSALDVFSFDGEIGSARSGFTSFAPAIKFNPISNVGNFTIQSAFHIPLVDQETEDGLKDANGNTVRNAVFLDQKGYTFQNRFFYDYTLPSGNWQLFTELNTEYHFGKKPVEDNNGNRIEGSFANNTFVLAPGVFMSYFPSDKSTVLGFVQHFQRFGDFAQDFTSLGFGGKYQLTEVLNLEVLYSKFVRGNDTGLGQSFNIGLRALF